MAIGHVYASAQLQDTRVAALDPLHFDRHFSGGAFVQAATADSSTLIRDFVKDEIALISLERARSFDEPSAMAAARDLNMVASVVTRLGHAMHEFPHLEKLLLVLAELTQEVPTDTVFGYGTRNPTGIRLRSFTGTPEEVLFIGSFVSGMDGLVAALTELETVQVMEFTDPRFTQSVQAATCSLAKMQEAILSVREHITPDFFTHRLRPFFDSKTVGGETLFAAGGAQMPVTMVDMILWGIEEFDPVYVTYRNENVRYLPRLYREKVNLILSSESMQERVSMLGEQRLTQADLKMVVGSLRSLQNLAYQMIRFRAPHLGVAKANMKIRPSGSVGSGGYDVAILRYLVDRTRKFQAALAHAEKSLIGGSS